MDEAVVELSDAEVGLHAKPDLSPLEQAFATIAEDLGEKNAKVLTSTVKSSLKKIDALAKDMGEQNAKVVADVQEVMKKIAADSDDSATKEMQRVVSEALGQIKMPDMSGIAAELSNAMAALQRAQTFALDRVADAVREMTEAVTARSAPEVEEGEPEAAPRWRFTFERDEDGRIIGAEATVADDDPRTALEAAQKASER